MGYVKECCDGSLNEANRMPLTSEVPRRIVYPSGP